jgi:FkbM family methyltransferase
MKIIFDIGANKGQNLNYFLDKADIVVAFEANSNLVEKIKLDFKQFIDNKKLIVENVALIDDENIKKIDFYISKVNDVLGTLYPDDISKFYKQEVRCEKASSLIKKLLKNYNISEIEYIKIDIEGADKLVLDDLLKNNILGKNLSIECHEPEVLELLLNSPYKSFKFVEGGDLTFKQNIEVTTKNNNKKINNFDIHSSGPYGEDIPGDYYSKSSILPYFLNKGLGWRDVHCLLEKKKHLPKIRYLPGSRKGGFRHHLKNLLPSFTKAMRLRICKIFNK